MMVMMINYFSGRVVRRKALSLVSSENHFQRFSPSQISNTPQAGFCELHSVAYHWNKNQMIKESSSWRKILNCHKVNHLEFTLHSYTLIVMVLFTLWRQINAPSLVSVSQGENRVTSSNEWNSLHGGSVLTMFSHFLKEFS